MKISIITTCYNMEAYIADTLESVLSQKGNFYLEYFVIDACSTDKTLQIIKQYEQRLKEGCYKGNTLGTTMEVICEPDNGMYDGIAKGMKKATGDIMAYINADDFYVPYAFALMAYIFEKYPHIQWMCGRRMMYNAMGCNTTNHLYHSFKKDFFLKGFYSTHLPSIQQETTFWKRDLLKDFDYHRFSSFKLIGDYYLWWDFCQKTDLYIINSVVGGARRRPGQLSERSEEYKAEVKKFTHYHAPNLIEKAQIFRQKQKQQWPEKKKMKKSPFVLSHSYKKGWIFKSHPK